MNEIIILFLVIVVFIQGIKYMLLKDKLEELEWQIAKPQQEHMNREETPSLDFLMAGEYYRLELKPPIQQNNKINEN